MTITTEKKTDFCWPALLDWVATQIFCHGETAAIPEHFQMQRGRTSHLVLPVFLNSSLHAGHSEALLFVLEKSAFSIIQLFSCSTLPFIGQSRKEVGHTEESCVWLRWYSTDSVRDNNVVFLFICSTMMHWTVQTPPPLPPAHLQLSRCHGVECPCMSLQWERKNDTDREQKSIRYCFPIHPPHPDLGCCNSDWRRKEEGQVQLIRDQWWSVCLLISNQEQWVGPAPPLPYTNSDVPLTPILAQIKAAGPANRGGPLWLSTVRGWCNSGTNAGRLREQKEEELPGQSRHGPWSLEDGPERILKWKNC